MVGFRGVGSEIEEGNYRRIYAYAVIYKVENPGEYVTLFCCPYHLSLKVKGRLTQTRTGLSFCMAGENTHFHAAAFAAS